MLALLLSSLLSVFFFAVFGTFVSKAAKLPANFAEKALLGLVASNTLTTILSLFYPIDAYIAIVLIVCCFCLCFFIKQELRSLFTLNAAKKQILLFALPFIIQAFIISLSAPNSYDSGLYHIQAIKWIEAYPVVPGLANLHGRFGFDPNIFTYFALTSLFDVFKQEVFSVNFTAFAILAIYFIGVLYPLFKEKGISNRFIFFLVIFLSIILLYDNLSSPSPDFLSVAIPLFVFARMVELSYRRSINLKSFIPLIILCLYILTTKLVTLPLLLLVVLILFKYRAEGKKLLWIIPVTVIIIIPWLARNVILTGWLVYPFPSINLFSFDWQVPIAKVISERDAITGWARFPRANFMAAAQMGFLAWAPNWWNLLSVLQRLFFVCGLCCPLITFAWQLVKRISIGFLANAVIATAFAGVLFWFFIAPDFRFGQAFILISALSPLLLINFSVIPSVKPYSVLAPIVIVFLFVLLINGRHYITNVVDHASEFVIKPEIIESPANLSFKTYYIEGVLIYVPASKDKCYCHAIPCAPHIDTTIALRNHILSYGFKPRLSK